MDSYTEFMIQKLESFGPQLFDLSGSLSLWIEIIGTLDNKAINSLLDLIENKSCDQKYNLAKRILIEGFDKVVNGSQMKTTIEVIADNEEEEEVFDTHNDSLITLDSSEAESNDSNEEQSSGRLIVDESLNQNEVNEEEDEDMEEILPMNQSSELLDTSDSYVDATEPSSLPKSPDSFKSALDSPDLSVEPSPKKDENKSEDKSLEILVESQTQSSNFTKDMSASTPFRSAFEDRLSGQILSLSPITSLYSQTKASLSPTISLNMSSTSSHSPKSTTSSRASKRSPNKSPEKIVEEYNCLVPYESYCSEQKYFKSSNESNSQSDSVFTDSLYEQIIKENIKTIESNND